MYEIEEILVDVENPNFGSDNGAVTNFLVKSHWTNHNGGNTKRILNKNKDSRTFFGPDDRIFFKKPGFERID